MGLLVALILTVALCCPAPAQNAGVRGQVTDESGAVVPNARVTITAPDGAVQTITTNDEGSYSLSGLAPGAYSVTASAPQLFTPQPAKIMLRAGISTVNLQLKVEATA